MRVADLSQNAQTAFEIQPDAARTQDIADELGLQGLRKLSFRGAIRGEGARDWRLEATLGATVVQPCGVTLEPVTTRIDQPVTRLFQHDYTEPDEIESEMPEDDSVEPLGRWIDPAEVMVEALVLALPLYPRAPGAELGEAVYAEDGVAPMRDEDAKPFAGLAGLRDRMKDDPEADR
ncbi:DUF177 domain-containing protein [Sulfitobacter sp. D35]|uniref:YceD family protein n=1 Tax=Sulfitobacter sp. D35 TaxID=3083252 RepID=UPI00296F30B4|nr:DUF177 domain-containing protein [Sulfitobacter sp. D35]